MKKLTLAVIGLLSVCAVAQAQSLATYQSAINAQLPSYYFTFDNTLVDSVGGSLTLSSAGGAYASDYFGNANSTRSFSASTDSLSTSDIIAGGSSALNGNPLATGVGSMSFLFRTLDSTLLTGQRFVFAQRSSTTGASNAFGLFFDNATAATDPGALKLRVGNGPTTSIMLSNSISVDSWYYFAVTYDETRDAGEVKWYLGQVGGSLSSGTVNIGNVAVVGDDSQAFVIGNSAVGATGSYRSPGNGQVDEMALWGRELSPEEVGGQFVALVPEPSVMALAAVGATLFGWRLRRKLRT